jgi:hypothetical protein
MGLDMMDYEIFWISIMLQYLYVVINPLNAKLNPICHLLALLGAHCFLHVSGLWVKMS